MSNRIFMARTYRSIQSAPRMGIGESTDRSVLESYLRSFGRHSLAYSTLLREIQHSVHEPHGYVAFVRWSRFAPRTLVLGDPVCSPNVTCKVLNEFVRENPRCSFWQIQEPTARCLNMLGFYVNEIGIDTTIDLDTFTVAGKKNVYVRRALNRAQKRGFRAVELADADRYTDDIRRIARSWCLRVSRYSHELRFLARPCENIDAEGVRVFAALRNDLVVAIALFDPIYADGRAIGYYASCLRSGDAVADQYRSFLVVEAARTFKAEGRKLLTLGLSPCYDVRDENPFRHSLITRASLRGMYRFANWLYNFRGLAMHKKRYGGRETTVYMATRGRVPLLDFVALFSVIGIRLGRLEGYCGRARTSVADG